MPKSKKSSGKINLVAARDDASRLDKIEPTNVSIESALRIVGPAIRRLLKRGWLDEDIVQEFKSQDPGVLLVLLKSARDSEASARRLRNAKKPKTTFLGNPALAAEAKTGLKPIQPVTPTLASLSLGRNRGIRPKRD